jgi:hypothetical protein
MLQMKVLTLNRLNIMTKTFTFGTKKFNTSSTIFSPSSTRTIHIEPDYSAILDDIICSDIKKKNSYLFDTIYTTSTPKYYSYLKDDESDLIKAMKFLANYKKIYKTKSYKLPYILGKMYTLSDGTPIVFYDDEIQIGFDTYNYSDFSNFSFLKGISDNTKKTIINIYTNGAANININLL